MLSGIYSVQFSSNLGDFGLGIAVFDKGKINGGDLTYLYRGKYNIEGQAIESEISVSHYQGQRNSVIGSLDRFTLHLTGEASNDKFTLTGNVTEQPQGIITITGTKVAELAT